jgi:predicted Ser/Thr protein kinase
MEYLVYQMVILNEEGDYKVNIYNNNIQMTTVIRRVVANNKEEAIGKFLVNTNEKAFKRRIDPIDCFLLSELSSIK